MRKGRSKLDQILAYGEGAAVYHPVQGHVPHPAVPEIHAPQMQAHSGYPHVYAGGFAPPPPSQFSYPPVQQQAMQPSSTPDVNSLRDTLERMQQRLHSLSQARGESSQAAPTPRATHGETHQQQADLLSRHHREVMDAIAQLRNLADGTGRALEPQRAELESLRATLEHQFANIERQLSADHHAQIDPQTFVSAIETSHLELSREITNLRQKLDASASDPARLTGLLDERTGELKSQVATLQQALDNHGITTSSLMGGFDDLRRDVTDLRDGLDRVEAFTMAPSGNAQELDTIGLRLEEITRAVIALSSNEAGLDQFQKIEARLSDLAHSLDEAAKTSANVEEDHQVSALANQITALSKRLETVNETVADFGIHLASPATPPELLEVSAGMEDMNRRMDALALELKNGQDNTGAFDELNTGFSALQTQIEHLCGEVAADRKDDDKAFLAMAALESKIADIGSQLGDLSTSIEARDSNDQLSDLRDNLDEVRRTVESISSRPVSVPVASGASEIDLSGFENRMLQMARAIDEMAKKPEATPFDPKSFAPLEDQLASMAAKLDDLPVADGTRVDLEPISDRLSQIEASIAELDGKSSDPARSPVFNTIENQLAEVIIRLEAAEDAPTTEFDTTALSERLLSIEQQLATSRDISIDLARTAAEDAVRQTVHALPATGVPAIDENVLGALTEDVRRLTNSASSASQDHMATFEAVRETLTVMNDRLEGVEKHLSSGFNAMQSSIDNAGVGKYPPYAPQAQMEEAHIQPEVLQENEPQPVSSQPYQTEAVVAHPASPVEVQPFEPSEALHETVSEITPDPMPESVNDDTPEAMPELQNMGETHAQDYPLAGMGEPAEAHIADHQEASFEDEEAQHAPFDNNDQTATPSQIEAEPEYQVEAEFQPEPVEQAEPEIAKPATAGASLVMAARAALAAQQGGGRKATPAVEMPKIADVAPEPMPVAKTIGNRPIELDMNPEQHLGPEHQALDISLPDTGLPEVEAPQLASSLPPETPPPPIPVDEDPLLVEDEPLEPGSGVPDLADLVRKAHEYRKEAAQNGDSRSVNEFRAIAQRAAQAAAAEASMAEQDTPVAKKPGLLSNLPGLIGRNRKAVIVAGAGILLAAVSVPLASKFIGGSSLEQTSVFGDSDPAPEEAIIVEEEQPVSLEPIEETAIDNDIPGGASDIEAEAAESLNLLRRVDEGVTEITPNATNGDTLTSPVIEEVTEPLVEQASLIQSNSLVEASSAGQATTTFPDPGFGSSKLRQAAQEGNPAAIFQIARRYTDGLGVEKDLSEAALWYERAANIDFAPAQYVIGNFHEKGIGLEKDLKTAANWYVKAADAGNIVAMHNLAVLHATPGALTETPDMAQAFKWFEKAADNGIRDSQVNLGIFYTKGIGTERDLVQAYKWFAVAGKSGDKDATAKRDVIGEALRPEQLEEARDIVKAWRPAERSAAANDVKIEESWKTPGSPAVPKANFKPDRKMIQVVQAALGKLGYDAGPPDGLVGERTRNALSAFQKKSGLAVNGQINPEVVLELQKIAKAG